MNRIQKTFEMLSIANENGVSEYLSNFENWTPEMVYIHVSRLLIGVILGGILGFILGKI